MAEAEGEREEVKAECDGTEYAGLRGEIGQVGALSRGLEGPDVSSHRLPLAAAGGIAGRRPGLELGARPR